MLDSINDWFQTRRLRKLLNRHGYTDEQFARIWPVVLNKNWPDGTLLEWLRAHAGDILAILIIILPLFFKVEMPKGEVSA